MQKVTIGSNHAGQRFDKFLSRHLSETGMGFIYKMLRKKNITLNGKKADGKELLSEGDEVSFFFSDETYQKFTRTDCVVTTPFWNAYESLKGITVLYEDEDVLILNKPAGILSQKAAEADVSANEWMLGYLLHTGALTEGMLAQFKPSVCNRLDRNTSGILLCGKTLPGSRELNRLIKEREIHKYYQLFVRGELQEKGLLEGYLTKDEAHNKVHLQKEKPQTGEASYIKTGFQPLVSTKKLTYLEVELFTGKTHQIRAHLAGIGHPLVGDYKYGDASFNRYFKEKYQVEAQLLHAVRLAFPMECRNLPQLNGKVIVSPLPEIFERILKEENLILQ